jgi:hypothetical protein
MKVRGGLGDSAACAADGTRVTLHCKVFGAPPQKQLS